MYPAVVLISGGRDSLFAACKMLEKDYDIIPLILDNGHIEGLERARWAVWNLQCVYGTNRVRDLRMVSSAKLCHEYMQDLWTCKASYLAKKYPDAQMYQLHCLICKTTMYVQALRFCKQNGCLVLVDGVRKVQKFFVDLDEMHERFTDLSKKSGVELFTPVYEVVTDQTLKRNLHDRQLPTKVIEPQCLLGCPMDGELNASERADLTRYYDNELAERALEDVKKLWKGAEL